MPATKGYHSLEEVCSCLKKPRGAGWEPGSTILLPPKAACFFLSLSIGKLIPLHAKWKLHFNCLFGSFSILLLFFPNYITILSAPFPLCLSRLKGWTRGTHWPLQLTWARNTNSIYLLSSLPYYFSFMKSNPWRNVSHTFTWSVWHTHKAAPWRQSSIIIICGVCIQPTSPYTTLALLLCNSCSSPTPHTVSVTCFQGNTFKNLTSKQSPTTLSPSKPILKGKTDWSIKFNHTVH